MEERPHFCRNAAVLFLFLPYGLYLNSGKTYADHAFPNGPAGTLHERGDIDKIPEALDNSDKITVIQSAASIRAADQKRTLSSKP